MSAARWWRSRVAAPPPRRWGQTRLLRHVVAVALVGSLWSGKGRAADGEVPLAELDCEAAAAWVVANHPLVEEALEQVREAEVDASVSRWLDSPELRLRADTGDFDEQYRVGMRWRVPAFGSPSARARAGEAMAAGREAGVEVTRARLAAEIRAEYAGARYAGAEREVLERLVRQGRELAATAAELTRAGATTAFDSETLRLQLGENEVEVDAASDREAAALEAIRRRIGGAAPSMRADCAPEPAQVDEVLSDHPEVRRAREEATAASEEATAARREGWLWPTFLEVTWVTEQQQNGVLLETGILLPVQQRESLIAEARERSAALQSRATEELVRDAAGGAQSRYRDATARVERIAAGEADLERSRAVVAEGIRRGADPADVWRLAREIARGESEANRARYEAELARIELRLRVGRP